jgi:hypothetical protein
MLLPERFIASGGGASDIRKTPILSICIAFFVKDNAPANR